MKNYSDIVPPGTVLKPKMIYAHMPPFDNHKPRNSKDDLRKIGEEFIYRPLHTFDYTSSTSEEPIMFRYRVIDHVLAPDFPGDLDMSWKEMLEPIEIVFE